MADIFLKIVNMSISASWIVLAVLLLRLLLKKAPKWTAVLLWGIVALRLICPFSIESVLSLIPSSETISPGIMMDKTPSINTGFPAVNNIINPVISDSLSPEPAASANPLQIWISVLSIIWVAGLVLLLAYTAISYMRVKRKIGTAVLLRDNVFQSESVVSPFVLGIIKPKIYLPFHISEQDMEHVIAHEQAHIRRKDHWWKPFGFLLLTLHWFNPLVWLGYILLCRDIELACDEKVVKEMNTEQRADYSQALLTCSVNRRMIAACPLAFGEVGVKGRVRSVLNYKKPALWIIIVAIIASITASVCFLTNPKTPEYELMPESENVIVPDTDGIYTDYDGVYISVKSIDTDADGHKVFHIVWHNDTSHEITYGEMYSIEFKDGAEWKGVSQGEIYFTTIGYLLKPHSTANKSYSSQRFDISKNGTYRLLSNFSIGDGRQYKTWIEFEVADIVSNIGEVDNSTNVISSVNIEQLKVKFPMYFNLPATKGLEVYIWQMAEGSYSCGLLSGRNAGYTQEELWELSKSSASINEMSAIIAYYISTGKITEDEVTILAIHVPYSSYYYTIDDAYCQKLKELFWSRVFIISSLQNSPIIDAAIFDIDGDGKEEQCLLSCGPTSGIYTIVLSASENGILEYYDLFYFPFLQKISFGKNVEGQTMLLCEDEDYTRYMSMHVENGNIVLTGEEQDISYWGERGIIPLEMMEWNKR